MKIYTRTGDRGETGLFGGGRVPKDDERVEAYGAVDELNAVLGVAIAAVQSSAARGMTERLTLVQADLFTIGSHLATPSPEEGGRAAAHIPPLPEERIAEMEQWIDESENELAPLRSFILPGGAASAAHLHHARTVCRRAERRAVSLSRVAKVDDSVIIYLNRLSDLLFTLARLANHHEGVPDVAWKGRGG